MEDYDVISIDRLCDILLEIFDLHRTLEQYKTELSNTFMRKDEHILNYIDRVKDLHRIIIDEENYRTNELTENKKI